MRGNRLTACLLGLGAVIAATQAHAICETHPDMAGRPQLYCWGDSGDGGNGRAVNPDSMTAAGSAIASPFLLLASPFCLLNADPRGCLNRAWAYGPGNVVNKLSGRESSNGASASPAQIKASELAGQGYAAYQAKNYALAAQYYQQALDYLPGDANLDKGLRYILRRRWRRFRHMI